MPSAEEVRAAQANRHCCCCLRPIDCCMGCVLARDFVAAQDGLIAWTKVRELCGICAIRLGPSLEAGLDIPTLPS